jgi:hypothetical protein
MSSDTGVRRMSPVNSQVVRLASMPDVPSNTCTTAFEPDTSSTWPALRMEIDILEFSTYEKTQNRTGIYQTH